MKSRRRQRGFFLWPSRFSLPSSDSNYPNVSLLLHLNNDLKDSSSSSRTVTANGSPTFDTSIKKFGSASLNFNGTSQYLTVPDDANFDFGSGDFTIECFVNIASLPSSGNYQGIFCQRASGSSNFAYALYLNGDNSGRLRFDWSTTGTTTSGNALSTAIPSTGVWVHCAVVRNGTNVTVYLDGVGGTPASIGTNTIFNSSNTPAVGVLSTSAGGFFNGKIDELRVTKGVARYTADFTPPNQPYSDIYTTAKLLCHFDGSNAATSTNDSSQSNRSFTFFGNAQLSTATAKFGASSLLLDGSGDYLTSPNSSDFDLSNGDFGISAWVYKRATGLNQAIAAVWGGTGNQLSWMFIIDNSERLCFFYSTNGSSGIFTPVSSGTIPLNTLTHVEVNRIGNVLSLYINGSQVYSATHNVTLFNATSRPLSIGASENAGSYVNFANMNIDELVISKGVALHSGAFTVPSLAY